MQSATAGTLESNDIFITITGAAPEESGQTPGNTVRLESIVQKQFGPDIVATIERCLERFGLTGVVVDARDKGALDCTIAARMEAAILRYKECAPC